MILKNSRVNNNNNGALSVMASAESGIFPGDAVWGLRAFQ
jgi:hypothetical protein